MKKIQKRCLEDSSAVCADLGKAAAEHVVDENFCGGVDEGSYVFRQSFQQYGIVRHAFKSAWQTEYTEVLDQFGSVIAMAHEMHNVASAQISDELSQTVSLRTVANEYQLSGICG